MMRTREFWLKLVLAAGFLAGFLLSPKLWLSARAYPLSPVWSRLPTVPNPWDRIWFVSLLLLLVGIILHPRPRWLLVAFVALAGLLSLWDQSRWQPWFYQYLFMCLALAWYPWRDPAAVPERGQAVLNACRVIVTATYFWSGLQKLNPIFVDEVHPWLIEPLAPHLPAAVWGKLQSAGIVVPFLEAGLGLALLVRRLRWPALVGAVAMHLFLLLCLGPLGHNWNTIVWPWNITMALLAVLLFGNSHAVSTAAILRPRLAGGHALILLLFGLMPALNFVNCWDSYLSAALYSGNTLQGDLVVSESVYQQLPPEVQQHFGRELGDAHRADFSTWSFAELNAPPYPARRVFQSIARHFCVFAAEPDDVILIIHERPVGWSKERTETRYDATRLQ